MPAAAPKLLLDILPYEVIEKIIFNIPNYETRDLKNCALASKAFIFSAQQSMFFKICLWKQSFTPGLIHLFENSPHLGTYVRELELDGHPRSTSDAEYVATLFRLMPSICSLILNRLEDEAPWEIIRSALEDVVLPQLHYLSIWCVYDAPVWIVKSCRQLTELHLNDCPLVLDDTSVVSIQQADMLPLRELRISELRDELLGFLCRSVTQLEVLKLPIYDGMYESSCDRSYMPLRRLPPLVKPMADTLVCLDIDAWPILHLNDRKISDHPFFVGQYPRLRYFYIRLGVGLGFSEEDGLVAESLDTQLAWLSSMLCEVPSSRLHPLTYIGISLYKWWALEHTEEAVKTTWSKLDLALAGDQSVAHATYPHLKELQFSPKGYPEHATDNMKKLLPLVCERGILVVNKSRSG
ncbi:hypothetical protein DL96DRAFT_718634 [Flagelloscypha sp. PMI_526]|nr:hypothetical protein DL96DRAFT_718634 [Flagelloscypha sp. PMI_526]